MDRQYITAWFSPADHELMVMFYETDGSSGVVFEADVLKRGSVIRTVRDNSLRVLESDIINRYGGSIQNFSSLDRPKRRREDLRQSLSGIFSGKVAP